MPDTLDAYLAAERLMPFAWGTGNGDCLLFLLGWGDVLGYRGSHRWRGTYCSEMGARSRLRAFGGAICAVTDVFGCPSMGAPPERGDVGLLEVDGWHLGMICTGRMWALRAGNRGVALSRATPDIHWNTRFNHAASSRRPGACPVPDGCPDLAG